MRVIKLIKNIYKSLIFVAILSCINIYAKDSDPNGKAHYTIATGSMGATYYPIGKHICDIVNKYGQDFTCNAISTSGSIYNLKSLQANNYDFAISQTIMQYRSFKGDKEFLSSGANKDLRMITPLHTETMILAVKKNSNISSFKDLKNKRVNIANKGSGTRAIIDRLLKNTNINYDYFLEIYEEKSSELYNLFCNDKIDAAIYSTGHPNQIYSNMILDCGVKLINLWDADIENFIKNNDEYIKNIIPANIYKYHPEEITGFGIPVSLSSSSKVPVKHIRLLIHLLKTHKNKLENKHPIFKTISFDNIENNYSAPYHAGSYNQN